MNSKKRILPQMYDIRPIDESGDLDVEKIQNIERIIEIKTKENKSEKKYFSENIKKNPDAAIMGDVIEANSFQQELKKFNEMLSAKKAELEKKNISRKIEIIKDNFENTKNILVEFKCKKEEDSLKDEIRENRKEPKENFQPLENKSYFFLDLREKIGLFFENLSSHFYLPDYFNFFEKKLLFFGKISIAIIVILFLFNFANKIFKIKDDGIVKGQEAFVNLVSAKDNIKKGDFEKSYLNFNEAYEKLNQVSSDLDGLGGILVDSTKYFPFISKISSGGNILIAGRDISKSGVLLSEILKDINNIKSGKGEKESISYLEIFQKNQDKLREISGLLKKAETNLEDVNTDDVPEKERDNFIELKKKLPELNNVLEGFLSQEEILIDILGGNGPRKYLFLFQNNQEMRATGGFIGSYGLLDMFNGRVRKFFIDGIFNPDGQLREKIIPPAPIQKISANWSLHDSNWFPDFPVSAEKASWFYGKTGGPTVDGVIAMTPTVMQKLLEITGPIEMPEYGVTVDENNFIENIQYEVEIDYDKELNQPKKILSDLAPKVLDRIFNGGSFSDISKTMNILLQSLNEKHILIYSKNWNIQKIISENGWSGEILNTQKDYLSVINTNINGYKTDGVIQEKIDHKAQIQPDGTILDTVTITRQHNGGDTLYEWWNKVNADYMRIYVPKGSLLLSAEGQTREFNSPPLDYKALGFKKDPQVQMEEDSIEIDEESGTRIYEEGDKTVFANWVYVSPKESVTIKYTYVLPFKLNMDSEHPLETYSLLAQKQSGSLGSDFLFEIEYPDSYEVSWNSFEHEAFENVDLPEGKKEINLETDLRINRFFGLAFSRK